jgi:hypothetical protein
MLVQGADRHPSSFSEAYEAHHLVDHRWLPLHGVSLAFFQKLVLPDSAINPVWRLQVQTLIAACTKSPDRHGRMQANSLHLRKVEGLLFPTFQGRREHDKLSGCFLPTASAVLRSNRGPYTAPK